MAELRSLCASPPMGFVENAGRKWKKSFCKKTRFGAFIFQNHGMGRMSIAELASICASLPHHKEVPYETPLPHVDYISGFHRTAGVPAASRQG
jgi:hypothetical protein